MAGAKSRSKQSKALCVVYKSQDRRKLNKARKMAKHMRENPNDIQTAKVLKSGNFANQKKAPKSNVWSHTDKKFAEMMGAIYPRFKTALHNLVNASTGGYSKENAELITSMFRFGTLTKQKYNPKTFFQVKERARYVE